jgi:hypothetical protein
LKEEEKDLSQRTQRSEERGHGGSDEEGRKNPHPHKPRVGHPKKRLKVES